jgi:hypothetical protein
MIVFRPLEIKDLPVIMPFFHKSASRLCERSATLCMWRDYFKTEIAVGESLYIKQESDGTPVFLTPIGGDFYFGMETILSYCRIHSIRAIFPITAKDELDRIRARYNVINVSPMRGWFDYLYESRDLTELKGRRYHGQRNHISRFERLYPDHQYLPLTDTAAAVDFLTRFDQTYPPVCDVSRFERTIPYEVLEHWEAYNQLGGVLTAGGRVISLTVGEVVGDTLLIHIEKADTAYHGAYQKTVNAFARLFGPKARYINREEDMGIEGLRKSKLSYHPVALLEKYTVEIAL